VKEQELRSLRVALEKQVREAEEEAAGKA